MTAPSELSYREIPLTQGKVAIVDCTDYDYISGWKWTALLSYPASGLYYAARSSSIKLGPRTTVSMHRAILGLTSSDKVMVDHVDGNGLNNRRSNLRLATPCDNARNVRRTRANKTGYKGVSLHPDGYYIARIVVNNNIMHLGRFRDPAKAHAIYCEAAHQYHGEFARTE